jgi:hypothetical protein
MTMRVQSKFKSRIAGLVAVGALTAPAPASAVSLAVELACAVDYYAYCSAYDSDGPEVRKCMRNNGLKLSRVCINALLGAGEITKAEADAHAKFTSK